MNRFRTKKRAKEDVPPPPEQSSMPSFKSFRRAKKSSEEEPKLEFDLTSALPSDDNFRTSLLMTNLSARFSMLREQDDPNTKIGKASDDSVLFPKRQSRLPDFGFASGLRGLSDIAEVESIKAPHLRNQIDSFVSDDADSTQGGSIMSRAKPTDGNVLFGGRQKIYKIPATSAKAGNTDGMSGRALYEDDVSMSAFQLWRQNEKRRHSLDGDDKGASADDQEGDEGEAPRSTSPVPLGYNQRRETSSTTSSASAVARNSTAATSITSQPPAWARDSQPTSTAASSTSSTPVLERSVTRTRRLYEQALTQDMHDQQSSALSRMDTLGRQRLIGNRTPDLAQVSPSPTNHGFHDRFGERRPVLTKASAPNLRSFSPPATASLSGTPDLSAKITSPPDNKTALGGSPPLSPPISETGEYPLLPIQPNDRGKATALGVFQKPLEPYDESKYAQRQLQLQQGRDIPNQRARAESNASFATGRSQSSSSMQRQPLDGKPETYVRLEPTVKEECTNGNDGTFFDDSDDSAAPSSPEGPRVGAPQVIVERPADRDHPALRMRMSALPTPLSVGDKATLEEPPTRATAPGSHQGSPPDSPTLGPTAGLSGLVRQHLRSESNASSIYGAAGPHSAPLDARFPPDSSEAVMGAFDAPSEAWEATSIAHERIISGPGSGDEMETEAETDEFANQLADARRRVRERLTSYAETDSSRECSPLRHADPKNDILGQAVGGNGLGLGILKPKSSLGSLVDRSRTTSAPQSKAMKMLGIGASTMTTSPSPGKQSFDEKDPPTLAPMQEEMSGEDESGDKTPAKTAGDVDGERKSLEGKDDDEGVHPGLRAFRQARRELQRRKELETLAKHQASPAPPSAPGSAPGSGMESGPGWTDQTYETEGTSAPGRDRMMKQGFSNRDYHPPPSSYQQRVPSDEVRYGRATSSNPGSRQTSTERNRSGSEVGGGLGQPYSRPLRLRNNSSPHEEYNHNHQNHFQQQQYQQQQQQQQQQHQYHQQQQQQLGPNNSLRQPMLRSPALPGTDIRRSPIMPPQGHPGAAPSSTMPLPQYLGQPSHTSPPNGLMTGAASRNEISDMSTNRGRSVGLPEGNRSRSGTSTGPSPPPLPPLNPLRKRESPGPARGGAGHFSPGRRGDEDDHGSAIDSAARLTPSGSGGNQDAGRGTPVMSDEEDGALADHRRRLRKAAAGNTDPHSVSPGFRGAPGPWQRPPNPNQFAVAGPPASRTVLTPGAKSPGTGVPGGMF